MGKKKWWPGPGRICLAGEWLGAVERAIDKKLNAGEDVGETFLVFGGGSFPLFF